MDPSRQGREHPSRTHGCTVGCTGGGSSAGPTIGVSRKALMRKGNGMGTGSNFGRTGASSRVPIGRGSTTGDGSSGSRTVRSRKAPLWRARCTAAGSFATRTATRKWSPSITASELAEASVGAKSRYLLQRRSLPLPVIGCPLEKRPETVDRPLMPECDVLHLACSTLQAAVPA